MTRRERLIEFIDPWTEWCPRQYEPRVGAPGLGYALKLNQLTDESLEELAGLIVHDFWWTKRLNRLNREIARARA